MTFALVLAGAVAGVLLAVTEAIWISVAVPSAVAPAGGSIAAFVVLVPRGFVVGAALGLGEALCLAAIQGIARLAGRRGGDEERCFAAVAGALLMVAIAALAQPLLRGREARFLTVHPVVLALVGAAVAWCSNEIALLLLFVAGSIQRADPGRRCGQRSPRGCWSSPSRRTSPITLFGSSSTSRFTSRFARAHSWRCSCLSWLPAAGTGRRPSERLRGGWAHRSPSLRSGWLWEVLLGHERHRPTRSMSCDSTAESAVR